MLVVSNTEVSLVLNYGYQDTSAGLPVPGAGHGRPRQGPGRVPQEQRLRQPDNDGHDGCDGHDGHDGHGGYDGHGGHDGHDGHKGTGLIHL